MHVIWQQYMIGADHVIASNSTVFRNNKSTSGCTTINICQHVGVGGGVVAVTERMKYCKPNASASCISTAGVRILLETKNNGFRNEFWQRYDGTLFISLIFLLLIGDIYSETAG